MPVFVLRELTVNFSYYFQILIMYIPCHEAAGDLLWVSAKKLTNIHMYNCRTFPLLNICTTCINLIVPGIYVRFTMSFEHM